MTGVYFGFMVKVYRGIYLHVNADGEKVDQVDVQGCDDHPSCDCCTT